MVAEISKANFDKSWTVRARRFRRAQKGRSREYAQPLLSWRARLNDKLARSHRPYIQLGHHGCGSNCFRVFPSTPTSHHGVLLFWMMLITPLLPIEARRYRFFDIYRARVRKLEWGYFCSNSAPNGEPKVDWAIATAKSSQQPTSSA